MRKANLPAPKTAILRSNLSPILYEPILLVSETNEREKKRGRETGRKVIRFAQEEGDKPLDRRIGERKKLGDLGDPRSYVA